MDKTSSLHMPVTGSAYDKIKVKLVKAVNVYLDRVVPRLFNFWVHKGIYKGFYLNENFHKIRIHVFVSISDNNAYFRGGEAFISAQGLGPNGIVWVKGHRSANGENAEEYQQ